MENKNNRCDESDMTSIVLDDILRTGVLGVHSKKTRNNYYCEVNRKAEFMVVQLLPLTFCLDHELKLKGRK